MRSGACLFPPIGHRSCGGTLPALGYRPLKQAEISAVINRETLVIAKLETPEAVANADGIAAVEGIDMLHIGASDLSSEMGLAGQYKHARMQAAYESVARAARAHGKSMGVGGVRNDPEHQTELLRLGVRYLTCGPDVGYIVSGGRLDTDTIRNLTFD